MKHTAPVRETPVPSPAHVVATDPSHPSVPNEPVLQIDEIQGNIIGGFLKDFQTNLYLQITNTKKFQQWLKEFIPRVSTSAQVLKFNRLFKSLRSTQQREPKLKVTWVNIAFSYAAIQKIAQEVPQLLKKDFVDQAFKDGLAARSESLGDETRPGKPGNKKTWKIGGPNQEADVIIIVASDDPEDMDDEVKEILSGLQGLKKMKHFLDRAATLPAALGLKGHEHFGFLDGVSQPGIRGRVSNDPTDVLTLRQNPNDDGQGKPGQDVLWPGEFVFGYKKQDAKAKDPANPNGTSEAGPDWAQNGSFLTFRRLLQNVFGFHSFLKQQAKGNGFASPDQFGSRLVGRWKSGAPVLREPDHDEPKLGGDDCANNNFEYGDATPPITQAQKRGPFDCVDFTFPTSPGDLTGARCPFSGHIRKAYPRNDTSPTIPSLGEPDTQTHRLLRRGIPFGKASKSTPDKPVNDGKVDRGLMFLAYQTSIENQFEFVTKNWVNFTDFKAPGTGQDPILGQNNTPGQNRERKFMVTDPGGTKRTVTTNNDWVIPTGGGYFFAPSISALKKFAS
jgi:Dyp-type peroxidase family